MHELSLINYLLRLVDREAIKAGGGRVTRVRVLAGEFSGVEPALLQSAFRIAAPTTSSRDASLEIQVVPLEAECRDCEKRTRVVDFRFVCAQCGSNQIDVLSGEELLLESITLSDEIESLNHKVAGDRRGESRPLREASS